MKKETKKLFIIPGWGETCKRKVYRQLARIAKSKGYKVIFKNPKWKQLLSEQIFVVSSEDTVFGFSLGANLAYIVGQKYDCKVIAASMTTNKVIKSSKTIKILGKKITEDLRKMSKIKPKKLITLYGELEKKNGDIIIPATDHELSPAYIKQILKLL